MKGLGYNPTIHVYEVRLLQQGIQEAHALAVSGSDFSVSNIGNKLEYSGDETYIGKMGSLANSEEVREQAYLGLLDTVLPRLSEAPILISQHLPQGIPGFIVGDAPDLLLEYANLDPKETYKPGDIIVERIPLNNGDFRRICELVRYNMKP